MKWKLMEGRESYGEIREILYREAVGREGERKGGPANRREGVIKCVIKGKSLDSEGTLREAGRSGESEGRKITERGAALERGVI